MYSEQKEALAQEIELKRPAVLAVSGLHNSGKTTLLDTGWKYYYRRRWSLDR